MPPIHVWINVDLYPYTRTTQKQKFVDPSYQKYHNAKSQIRAAVNETMQLGGIPKLPRVPLRIALFVNLPARLHTRDLSNVIKGVEDGAQHAAYDNDAWVDQLLAVRALGPQGALFIIQPISEGPASFAQWHVEAEKLAIKRGLTLC